LNDSYGESVILENAGLSDVFLAEYFLGTPECMGITVLSPSEAGNIMEVGQDCTIQWRSAGLASNARVRIELCNAAGTACVIAPAVKNTGKYRWRVGKWDPKFGRSYNSGIDYKIRVCTIDGKATGESAAQFAVARLTGVSLKGPSAVKGGSDSVQYVCTAFYDVFPEGVTRSSDAKWKCLPTVYAQLRRAGVLSTTPVPAPTQFTLQAMYGKGKSAFAGALDVTITP